jgi:hypothetical protein
LKPHDERLVFFFHFFLCCCSYFHVVVERLGDSHTDLDTFF